MASRIERDAWSWIAYLSVSFHHFPFLSCSFQSFGGWVNGQIVINGKEGTNKHAHTHMQTYSHYNIDLLQICSNFLLLYYFSAPLEQAWHIFKMSFTPQGIFSRQKKVKVFIFYKCKVSMLVCQEREGSQILSLWGNDPMFVWKWSNCCGEMIQKLYGNFAWLEVLIIGYKKVPKNMYISLLKTTFLCWSIFTYSLEKNITQPLDHFPTMIGSPNNHWIISICDPSLSG